MLRSLSRWRPLEDFEDLRGRMDRMFEELTGRDRLAVGAGRRRAPRRRQADRPRRRARLQARGDQGRARRRHADGVRQHEESSEDKQRSFLRRERRYGAFRRSIALPPDVDADAIEAITHDGVLEVTVPLPEKEAAAHKVITPKPA